MPRSSAVSVGPRSLREGRIPADRPLPGLNLPDIPEPLDSVHEARQAAISAAALRVAAKRRFRAQLEEYHRATEPPFDHREIVVRFVVGRDSVGAVVDWRAGGVGRGGLLRRIGGPLALDPGTVRRVGPGVALHECLRALLQVTPD